MALTKKARSKRRLLALDYPNYDLTAVEHMDTHYKMYSGLEGRSIPEELVDAGRSFLQHQPVSWTRVPTDGGQHETTVTLVEATGAELEKEYFSSEFGRADHLIPKTVGESLAHFLGYELAWLRQSTDAP